VGLTNTDIAAQVGCHANTVSTWRKRFELPPLSGSSVADRPLLRVLIVVVLLLLAAAALRFPPTAASCG